MEDWIEGPTPIMAQCDGGSRSQDMTEVSGAMDTHINGGWRAKTFQSFPFAFNETIASAEYYQEGWEPLFGWIKAGCSVREASRRGIESGRNLVPELQKTEYMLTVELVSSSRGRTSRGSLRSERLGPLVRRR